MTIKVGTNQTNQADCPTPIEPEATTPPKADDLESIKKGMGPGLVPEHLGESGFMDTVKSGLDFAKSGLDFADKAVDLVRDIPIIGNTPTIVAADKATDAALEIYEQASKVPGALGEVLYESEETRTRILERTNDLLADTFGEDAPRIAVKPEDICWDTTFDAFTNPKNIKMAMNIPRALTIETAAEVHPELTSVLESKPMEMIDTTLDNIAKYAPFACPFLAIPSGIYLMATGETPSQALYRVGKETLAGLTDPANQRELFKVANGPTTEQVESLKSNETFTTKYSGEFDVTAVKGGKIKFEVERTVGRRENGDYYVAFVMNQEAAAALGLSKVGKVTGGGGQTVNIEYNIKDADLAANLARADFIGSTLAFLKNPEMPGVERVKIDTRGQASAEVGEFVKLKSAIGGSFDIAKLEGEAYYQLKGVLDLSTKIQAVAISRKDDELRNGVDFIDELISNPLSNSGSVSAQYGIVGNLEDLAFEVTFAAQATVKQAEIGGEVKISVDLGKAAKALGMTVDDLRTAIDSGKFDASSWWQSLPDDIVTVKSSFQTKFHESKVGATVPGFSAEHYKTVTETKTAGEMLAFLRGEEARDQQLSRLRS